MTAVDFHGVYQRQHARYMRQQARARAIDAARDAYIAQYRTEIAAVEAAAAAAWDAANGGN